MGGVRVGPRVVRGLEHRREQLGQVRGVGRDDRLGTEALDEGREVAGRTEAIETANGSCGSAVRTSAIALRAGTGAAPSPA